jgi:aspartyl-tRNA(Asn)/glutamyl-tRNA(Gln) amidotransferase subunit C
MKLSKAEVEHVALLARLELTGEEKDRLTGHLNEIMVHFEKLQQLDTEDVEPTSHSIPVRNVFRDDVAGPSLPAETAVANAPESVDNYFIVPQVVEM